LNTKGLKSLNSILNRKILKTPHFSNHNSAKEVRKFLKKRKKRKLKTSQCMRDYTVLTKPKPMQELLKVRLKKEKIRRSLCQVSIRSHMT
jgi:hypothetical protein